jgi:hypothetical protein
MFDKVDARVDLKIPFTREFQEVYNASICDEKSPWRGSKYFARTADMRGYGYDVRLHLCSILTEKPVNKIEIYDAGEKTYQEVRRLAASVFDCDPGNLGLMRLDLCADIHGVDVNWFKRHTMVQFKRTNQELGKVYPYRTIRRTDAETLYAGLKPNQFRIYNKTEERMMQWRRSLRRSSREAPGAEHPSFEVMFGHSENETITRVERQIVARDLQRMGFSDVNSLQHGAFIDPFENIQFFEPSQSEPSMEKYGYKQWTSGMFLRQMAQEQGLAQVRGWMREQLGRNMYREWNRMEEFLHVPDHLIGIDGSTLRKAYHSSLGTQLHIRECKYL